ncbi:hypothetical protein, partial [Microcystis aeruginosa]|uniref:hypothetical protein n=1 Tax=Microcystis aeruginosa TaxID=1126 RepID=UPI001C0F2F2C
EFCQGDYGGDPCYEAVFSDQGWDGLPPLSIYKVGLNDSETQQPRIYVGFRCLNPTYEFTNPPDVGGAGGGKLPDVAYHFLALLSTPYRIKYHTRR